MEVVWSDMALTQLDEVIDYVEEHLFDRWRASCNYGDCSCQAVSASRNFHD